MAYPFGKSRIKKAVIGTMLCLISVVLAVILLLATFFLFYFIQNNAHLVFIYRESIPEVKLGFIGLMIFTGLHLFGVLLTVFFKRR
jgi:uncharacterized membrane protein